MSLDPVMADSGLARGLGALRMAVGVAMLAAPRLIGRSEDPSFQLLLRTIGVRDLVLDAGAVRGGGGRGHQAGTRSLSATRAVR